MSVLLNYSKYQNTCILVKENQTTPASGAERNQHTPKSESIDNVNKISNKQRNLNPLSALLCRCLIPIICYKSRNEQCIENPFCERVLW